MERRVFMKAGLGLATLPLLDQLAFGADAKPISFWYEAADPANQQNIKDLLITPFNTAHPESSLSIDFPALCIKRTKVTLSDPGHAMCRVAADASWRRRSPL